MNTDPVPAKGSALDLSFLHSEPAGAFGRVCSNDRGELFFEKRPGETVRFNGANLAFQNVFPEKEQAPVIPVSAMEQQ